jgi:hypothetical protein
MTLTPLERRIVQIAKDRDMLAELCDLIEYDPDIGRVNPYWAPKWSVMVLARELMRGERLEN